MLLLSLCQTVPILNWLTLSDSKDVGKEEERDSEAVSFVASSTTFSLCDLWPWHITSETNLFCLFSLQGGTNIYQLFSSVALINSLTYAEGFLSLWCSVYVWSTTLEFVGFLQHLWFCPGVDTLASYREWGTDKAFCPLPQLSWMFWMIRESSEIGTNVTCYLINV